MRWYIIIVQFIEACACCCYNIATLWIVLIWRCVSYSPWSLLVVLLACALLASFHSSWMGRNLQQHCMVKKNSVAIPSLDTFRVMYLRSYKRMMCLRRLVSHHRHYVCSSAHTRQTFSTDQIQKDCLAFSQHCPLRFTLWEYYKLFRSLLIFVSAAKTHAVQCWGWL